jgi:hypothetical protein
MRRLADAFVASTQAWGHPFGWDLNDVRYLDAFCDAVLQARPRRRELERTANYVGAWMGEMLIRQVGGHWYTDATQGCFAVTLDNGLQAYPSQKVLKRLTLGPQHELRHYFTYAISREVGPGAELREIERE